jgi:hypothetical protein
MIARYLFLSFLCAFQIQKWLGVETALLCALCVSLSLSLRAARYFSFLSVCLCVKVDVFLSALRFICTNCVCFLLCTVRLVKEREERRERMKREFTFHEETQKNTLSTVVKTRI